MKPNDPFVRVKADYFEMIDKVVAEKKQGKPKPKKYWHAKLASKIFNRGA